MTSNDTAPTGDQIMSAARTAIADEFPDAAPTASAHANKLANRLCELLAEDDLPDPLTFALDEVLATVNGVDPVERDAEYEDCSDEELHIHKQLGRIRALISQVRAENPERAK